jgi:hypothetical protein
VAADRDQPGRRRGRAACAGEGGRVLTAEESERLVEALIGKEYELPILFGLYCAIRPAEYCGLSWRNGGSRRGRAARDPKRAPRTERRGVHARGRGGAWIPVRTGQHASGEAAALYAALLGDAAPGVEGGAGGSATEGRQGVDRPRSGVHRRSRVSPRPQPGAPHFEARLNEAGSGVWCSTHCVTRRRRSRSRTQRT